MKRSDRPTGKPAGIVPNEVENQIKNIVDKTIEASPEPLKSQYRANMEEFSSKNKRSITNVQVRLSVMGIPRYVACAEIPLARVLRELGIDPAWPSDDMANAYALLEKLSPAQIPAVMDLIQRITPSFWRDKRVMAKLTTPKTRLQHALYKRPLIQRQEANRLAKDALGSVPKWLLRYDAAPNDLKEIIRLSEALDISPAWALCWDDWPVLAKTPDHEKIMAGYSFLSKPLRGAFCIFLEKLGQLPPDSVPSMPATPPPGLDQFPSAKVINVKRSSLYKEVRHNLLVEAKEAHNRPTYNISTALQYFGPLASSVKEDIFSSPSITEAETDREKAKLLALDFTFLSKIQSGERGFPTQAVIQFCCACERHSIHQLLSGQYNYVPLPGWLGGTADLLENSRFRFVNNLIAQIEDEEADMFGVCGDSSPFYPESENIDRIFLDRVLELAEDKYADQETLFGGLRWQFLTLRANLSTVSKEKMSTKPLPVNHLTIFALVLDTLEDFLVRRNYLEYLPAAYMQADGTWAKAGNKTNRLLRHILRRKPESRNPLLANIWLSAYFGKK